MLSQQTEIRVRYADTDQMRIVYYAKFFEYFEQGRSDLLRSVGMPYGELEEAGFYLPVIEAHAEYKRTAHFDDLLIVQSIMRERPVARVRIDYDVVRRGEEGSIATGYTVHSFVNRETGKPTRVPAQFLEMIGERMTRDE
jgi:acyl-CoA thioester hydrolase